MWIVKVKSPVRCYCSVNIINTFSVTENYPNDLLRTNTYSISQSDTVIHANASAVTSRAIKAHKLKFDCNSLHIQRWEIFYSPLRGLSQWPKASWDCQWMANNHANNNNDSADEWWRWTFSVGFVDGFILQSLQKDGKKLPKSRITVAQW